MAWLGALCLACALRFLSSAATIEILIELPNLSDEVLEPKYEVAVARHTLSDNETEAVKGWKTVSMNDSHGREFACYLPKDSSTPASTDSESKEPDLPSKLLEPLEDACLYRVEEWWTYEVCYHKQIRQYHKHGNSIVSEYTLGKFSGNTSEVDEIHREGGLASFPTAYVRESFVNGTPCDIVDKERSTEVRYTCADDDKTALVAVEELHSCAYQITIATPFICKHPDFKGIEVPVREMKCHPLVEPEPQSTQQLGTTKAGTEEVGSKTSTQEEEQEEEEEEGEEDDQIVTEIHMDDLDEAALDQLISSIIRMGASDDADADFLDEENESDDEEDLPSGRTGRTEL